jgi:O-antigen ligase
VEHGEAAQVAALVGGLGATLVLLTRGRAAPLAGFALLGLATALIGRSLVGYADLKLLFTQPSGLGLVAAGALGAAALAFPLARHPTAIPVALLAVAPFRIPVRLGGEDAFLLLPLYLVLSAAVLALAYRIVRGDRPPAPPLLLGLPLAVFVALTAASFLWTWDTREGGITLAFFFFPFTAGFGVVARTPVAPWLGRAFAGTLVALGLLFASIGLWQAHTRTLFFAPDLQVANAYTTFFRVTSLFKDPSLYGRYLVVAIGVLLVALWFRSNRSREWAAMAALIGFLFVGLYFSYSQSSFVALFAVALGVAFLGGGRRLKILLVVIVAVTVLAGAAVAAQELRGRSVNHATSGRTRLVTVTLDAFEARPVTGVGIGGQPRASYERSGVASVKRDASHTAPLTVLAEAGVVGFALYVWTLVAAGWALLRVTRRERALGIGLASVLLVLFVHSLLYAGFFEDPLTWGVLAVASAVLTSPPAMVRDVTPADVPPVEPRLLAH